MIPQKKPYVKPEFTIIVKPEFTIIHPGTPKYEEIMEKIKAEDQAQQQCVASQAKQ